VLIDVRVLDQRGHMVAGLGPADFEVIIDGERARVASAGWFGGPPSPVSSEPTVAPAGRLFVLLIQKTLDGTVARREPDLIALSRALQLSDPLLAQVTPADRVAVLSLDSHLRIWSDFTADVGRVRHLLRTEVMDEHPPSVASSFDVSLFPRLSQQRREAVYTMEDALRLLGDALKPLDGSKTVVLFGFGFGRPDALKRSLVETAYLPGLLDEGYKRTLASLIAARVTVFSLDVTAADRHALEMSFERVARDTGGIFTRTFQFPDLAIEQLAQASAGHYVLAVERPKARPGTHDITIRLVGKAHQVHAPKAYVD